MEAIEKIHSICDNIMELKPEKINKQPMGVIEHILHHVTMVGLHYNFYEDWGVSKDSN